MKKLSLLFIAAFLLINTFAANVQLTVKLKNGDVITGKSVLPKITVVSPYGSLSIPIEKISNIKLGVPSDHTKDGAVQPDLSKLQTASQADAKAIYDRLLNYGTPILSTVVAFTQNPFYKISENENYTIEQLIDELMKKANITTTAEVNDAVTFDGINYVEGSIAFGDIILQAEYGNLTFKREKIESLDVSVIEETTVNPDGSFKLKANYNISGNDNNKGWLNTGVKVKNGDKFSIIANGKIVLKSLSGGSYNPDGYVAGTKDAAYTDDTPLKYGALVYKIGEYGEAKQAGSKYDGVAVEEEGTIYVAIYETVFDKTNSGAYNVKVTKK